MKRIAFLALVGLFASISLAQGVSFGRFNTMQKQKVQKAKLRAQATPTELAFYSPKAMMPIEEFSEIVDNRYYRFVYAYDTNKQRASETIYVREKEGDAWGEEQLYAVGTYSYEYDTQGRVKTKTVKYDRDEIEFTSYRVMVDYNTDGSTAYSKYEWVAYNQNYEMVEQWIYRADGSLQEHIIQDDGSLEGGKQTTYDPQGNVTRYNQYQVSGGLNNTTITYQDDFGYDSYSLEHFVYDDKTGKLLEFQQEGEFSDTEKYVFEYDEWGRIKTINVYGEDSEAELPESGEVLEPTHTRTSNEAHTWVLNYQENYTYFNDEVYDFTNSWKCVFNMDGPVSSITYKEFNTYENSGDVNGDGYVDEKDSHANCEYTDNFTFQRNNEGRLLSVECNNSSGYMEGITAFTIDDNGQIVRMINEESESWDNGSYYSLYEQNYTWENGKVVQLSIYDKYVMKESNEQYEGSYESTSLFTYTDHSVTEKITEDNGTTKYVYRMQAGNRFEHRNWYADEEFDWDKNTYIIREIQREDVSFIRPNPKKDLNGFTPEVPTILSRAGRVVCVADNLQTDRTFFQSDWDDEWHYQNVLSEDDEYSSQDEVMGIYYAITHDGEKTIASNVKGWPIYVLKGSQLLKEYKYYYLASSMGGAEGGEYTAKSLTFPEGMAYDEISYRYNNDGLLVGKEIISVDENGTKTEVIDFEYKYDLTGIAQTQISAPQNVCITGRTLGTRNNQSFSVYHLSGQLVVKDVMQHQFTQPGNYLIVLNNETIKVHIQ